MDLKDEIKQRKELQATTKAKKIVGNLYSRNIIGNVFGHTTPVHIGLKTVTRGKQGMKRRWLLETTCEEAKKFVMSTTEIQLIVWDGKDTQQPSRDNNE